MFALNSKKNILIFLGSLTGGGAERVATTLSKFLSNNRSYNVTLVTLGSKRRDFYDLDASVSRIAMNLDGETKGLSKITSNIQRVVKFRKLLKKENPDLVIAFMTRYAVISLLASIFLKIKIIVSERNYPPLRANHGMWEWFRKYVYKYADLHVVQTKLIADWIKEKTQSKKIAIIPNSISWPLPDYEPFLDPDNYLNEDDKVILAAGTFKYQKGFDMLITSSLKILKERPGWKLVILGDEKNNSYTLTNSFKDTIKRNGLSESVIMPGRAGNIADWYKRADIFVLSSRFEGFPNVLLEAMASGCVCVSFDCKTGPSEMITHLESGILVPECDMETLSDQVIHLIDHPELRRSMSKKAMKVRERFSENTIMRQWEQEIERCFNH